MPLLYEDYTKKRTAKKVFGVSRVVSIHVVEKPPSPLFELPREVWIGVALAVGGLLFIGLTLRK